MTIYSFGDFTDVAGVSASFGDLAGTQLLPLLATSVLLLDGMCHLAIIIMMMISN